MALSWITSAFSSPSSVTAPLLHGDTLQPDELAVSPPEESSDLKVLVEQEGDPKIVVRGLSLAMDDGQLLLSSVDLSVHTGKVHCVIGPSGSGKSTFLRCLNRLNEPTGGSILLDGIDTKSIPVPTLRRRVGVVMQTATLFDGTVADNIRYGPKLVGVHLSDVEVVQLLNEASLDASFAERNVSTLSGGQAQRVSIARTLANVPEVLLLDEPTSALDPAATAAIESTVKRLVQSRGLAAVWVSHSGEQVLRVADQVTLLVHGEVRDRFSPANLHDGNNKLAVDFLAGLLDGKRLQDVR